MPLTHLLATRLGKKLTDVRKDGSLWWLRPDGKTQVRDRFWAGWAWRSMIFAFNPGSASLCLLFVPRSVALRILHAVVTGLICDGERHLHRGNSH